jgi:hypothetical protein
LDDGSFPQSDGTFTVYVKSIYDPPFLGTERYSIWYHDANGNHQLTGFGIGGQTYGYIPMPDTEYRVENGWIACIGAYSDVRRRSPSGELSFLDGPSPVYSTEAKLLALSPSGDVMWTNSYTGTISRINFDARWIFQNSRWEILGGPTLFSVFGPALTAHFENGAVVISSWGSAPQVLSKTNVSDQWQSLPASFAPAGPYNEYRFQPSSEMQFFR